MNVTHLIAVLSWEPWRYTPQEIVAMTPAQVRAVLVPRDKDGNPEFDDEAEAEAKPILRGRVAHDWRCYLDGIPKFEAERLWQEMVRRGEVQPDS